MEYLEYKKLRIKLVYQNSFWIPHPSFFSVLKKKYVSILCPIRSKYYPPELN